MAQAAFSGPYATALAGVGALLFLVAGFALVAQRIASSRAAVDRRVASIMATAFTDAPDAADKALFSAGIVSLPPGHARELVRRLETFGVPAVHAGAVFLGIRLAVVALCSAAAALGRIGHGLDVTTVGLVTIGMAIGWFLPYFLVHTLLSRRRKRVEAGLADAIELLVVSVEAGLALEDALDRVVVELRRSQPDLADELAETSADLKILPSREQALANLAARMDVPGVRSVATTLSQTMRYGTPLTQALRVVATELRNEGLLRLEERANKMPVLLTIPMIVFILPSVFLLIAGPALLRVLDIYLK